jgi:hypothetical protein
MAIETCSVKDCQQVGDWRGLGDVEEFKVGEWNVKLEKTIGGALLATMTRGTHIRTSAYAGDGWVEKLNEWMSLAGSDNYPQFRDVVTPKRTLENFLTQPE